MRRRLFNAAALLSLVLYVITLGALARSLYRFDQLVWIRPEDVPPVQRRWYEILMSGRGGIEFARDAEVYDFDAVVRNYDERPVGGWRYQGRASGPPRYPRPAFNTGGRATFGFWFKWTSNTSTVRREIIVPYWFLAILTGTVPALWLVRRRRESLLRRRVASGLCVQCGYDLRASRDT